MDTSECQKATKEIQEKMSQYREIFLKNGFLEPTKAEPGFFYKPNKELTAFVINLSCSDNYIEVFYGYASTAFTLFKGDENALIEKGVYNENINLRNKKILSIETPKTEIDTIIKELYEKYSDTDKEKLLDLVKEKRKSFINKITEKLKPLGFKKKATNWKYTLGNNYYLMFNAQKSSFSDEYYFNVYIGKENADKYGDCFYTRIAPQNMFPADWQIISDEQFEEFLDNDLEKLMKHIISTPLNELGKEEFIKEACDCDGKQCDLCWVHTTN